MPAEGVATSATTGGEVSARYWTAEEQMWCLSVLSYHSLSHSQSLLTNQY